MTKLATFCAHVTLVGLSIGFWRRVWLSVVVVPVEIEVFVCLLVDPLKIRVHRRSERKPNLTLIIDAQLFLFLKSFRKLRIQIMNGGSHGIS